MIQPHEVSGEAEPQSELMQRRAVGMAREAAGASSDGHVVVVIGPIAFCARCASFAIRRLGAGLKGVCIATQTKTRSAVAARLRRLRAGRHPITGKELV